MLSVDIFVQPAREATVFSVFSLVIYFLHLRSASRQSTQGSLQFTEVAKSHKTKEIKGLGKGDRKVSGKRQIQGSNSPL